MAELLDNLALGFGVVLQPYNLLFAFVGVALGTLVGMLPGLGPLATMSLLLPMTMHLPHETALIMLAGIYYGSQYGGSTTAILMNLPGESSAAVTCVDGYQMARQGRAGAALTVAALGSLFAGTVATLFIALFALPLAQVGLMFGAPEYFALMSLGLIGTVVLAQGSLLKAIGMILLGLTLGLVGTDINTGMPRFTFGNYLLEDGIDFVVIAVGIFGLSEIIANLERRGSAVESVAVGRLGLSRQDFIASYPAVLRGTGIGSLLGILPGGGALLSSFASYAIEKRISKEPWRFGNGAIEGVAGPESANNAGAQTSFIPMLTLGIPSNAVMAIMIGAMTMYGLAPGPRIMADQPSVVWALICSMWVGNLFLVIINLPLIRLWVSLLNIPYRLLFPAICVICGIGVYSVGNSTFDVTLTAAFAALGYLLIRFGCEAAPFALAFILGPMMEENLRRAMALSRGDPMIFFTRPISASLLLLSVVLLAFLVLPAFRKNRDRIFAG